MALISSYKDKPVGEELIAFGEIGLAGECRAVSHAEARMSEAVRLGFDRVVMSHRSAAALKRRPDGIEIIPARSIFDLQSALGI